MTSLSQTVSKSPSKQSSHEAIPFDLEITEQTDEQELLLTFLNQHRSMFATNLQDLGQANIQPHCIETDDDLPFRQRFYRQSPQTNAEMNRQLQEMLDADIIEESDSMWQSPVVMVKKNNGQLQHSDQAVYLSLAKTGRCI